MLSPIEQRLQQGLTERLGEAWMQSWQQGLPSWQDTPGDINLPVLLWLHTLLQGWDLESFAQARYGLLGNGSHWFPGRNANRLRLARKRLMPSSEAQLLEALAASPWQQQIPESCGR